MAHDTPRVDVDTTFFNPPSLDRHMATILDFDRWRSSADQDGNPFGRTGASQISTYRRPYEGNDSPRSQVNRSLESRVVDFQDETLENEKGDLLLDKINAAEDLLFSRIIDFLQIEDMQSFTDEEKEEILANLDREYLRSIILHEMKHVMMARVASQPTGANQAEPQASNAELQDAASASPARIDSSQAANTPSVASPEFSAPPREPTPTKRTPAKHLAATGSLVQAMSRLWPTLPTLSESRDS